MEKKRKREPWLFLLPVLVVLLLLFGYPLINSIVMAFQNYKLTAPNDIYFNGFENFKKLFGDPDGLMILKNSIIYVVISVAGQFLLGLTLALACFHPIWYIPYDEGYAMKYSSKEEDFISPSYFCRGLFPVSWLVSFSGGHSTENTVL